ncbi:hypothetical protein GGS20DRAFT_527287, partial [Poronia punctata]
MLAKATTERHWKPDRWSGRVGFFLNTDDFARDHKLFTERGVKFREQPRNMAYGTVVVFEDVYGNTWDLIQPKEYDDKFVEAVITGGMVGLGTVGSPARLL